MNVNVVNKPNRIIWAGYVARMENKLLACFLVRNVKVRKPLARPRPRWKDNSKIHINPLNAKLNPICHLLALLGAHPILHISRIRVKDNG